jgi:hypothetical protein
MRTLLASLVLAATATAAHADAPGMTTPIQPLAEPASISSSNDDGPKSVTGATGLAIGGSLLGPALITAALLNDENGTPFHNAEVPMLLTGSAFVLLGPSIGNWYAGKGLSKGLGMRLLGAGATVLGAGMFVEGLFSNDSTAIVGLGVGLAGLGTIAVGTLMDIVDAHHTATDYNRSHRLTIAPMISRTPTGQQTGLSIGGAF